jgi:hypothetical protein
MSHIAIFDKSRIGCKKPCALGCDPGDECPGEAAAAATEIGADDYEPADMEVLWWLFKTALGASAVLMLGVFAWQLLDLYSAGFLA